MADLTSRAIRGSGAMLLSSGSVLAMQAAGLVILSRLLTPVDFGLAAMVTVFVSLAAVLRDFGLSTAALQARTLSHQQASNLFWANVCVGALVAGLMVAGSPLVAALYGDDRVAGLLPLYAVAVLVSAGQGQYQVHLSRSLRWKALASTNFLASAVALCFAVALAWLGCGYWALAAQAVIGPVALLVSRVLISRWFPIRPRRGHSSKALLIHGGNFGFAYLLQFAVTNIDSVLIGGKLGASALGFYSRSYQLLSAPISQVLGPLLDVVIPWLNGTRADSHAFRRLILAIQLVVGSSVVWVFAATAGCAPEFIGIMLGPGWAESAGVFRILAVGGIGWALSNFSYWMFVLESLSSDLVKSNLISKPLVILLLVIGSHWGLEGVAWGYAAGSAVNWPITMIFLRKSRALPIRGMVCNGLLIAFVGFAAWASSVLVSSSFAAGEDLVVFLLAMTASLAVSFCVLWAVPFSRSVIGFLVSQGASGVRA